MNGQTYDQRVHQSEIGIALDFSLIGSSETALRIFRPHDRTSFASLVCSLPSRAKVTEFIRFSADLNSVNLDAFDFSVADDAEQTVLEWRLYRAMSKHSSSSILSRAELGRSYRDARLPARTNFFAAFNEMLESTDLKGAYIEFPYTIRMDVRTAVERSDFDVRTGDRLTIEHQNLLTGSWLLAPTEDYSDQCSERLKKELGFALSFGTIQTHRNELSQSLARLHDSETISAETIRSMLDDTAAYFFEPEVKVA